jgi:hypothetical protein
MFDVMISKVGAGTLSMGGMNEAKFLSWMHSDGFGLMADGYAIVLTDPVA